VSFINKQIEMENNPNENFLIINNILYIIKTKSLICIFEKFLKFRNYYLTDIMNSFSILCLTPRI